MMKYNASNNTMATIILSNALEIYMQKKHFINVTQDGIARMSEQTPKHMLGCYTDSLQTCFVYIFVGQNDRVSFCHASLSCSVASLLRESNWVGPLKKWFVIINAYYNHYRHDTQMNTLQELTMQLGMPPERCQFHDQALAISYDRLTQTVTEEVHCPIIMPPFADKALAISFLNSLLSDVASCDLQLQYDENQWQMSDNRCEHLIKLYHVTSLNDLPLLYRAVPLPSTVSREAFDNAFNSVRRYLDLMWNSCQITTDPMFKLHVDSWGLKQLESVTGYQFVGTLNSEHYATAWLFCTNYISANMVADKLRRLTLTVEEFNSVNQGNSMTRSIYGVKVRNINVDSNLQLLAKN
tara:strand:- start:5621 stop:6679 length:1059 start_codon:yes stop_codon:yes gene_type:complete